MDLEKRARMQSIRVIISEILMFLTVVVMVFVLGFVVSGYWVGTDFKVERQGMLQISSSPSGADVIVDGETSWMQRTNTSKILSSGQHNITLTKEGYDSWSKDITIKEGLLYRLYYPRLFLNEREKEEVYDITSTNFATISPNHNLLLLANNTSTWSLLKLNSDKVEAETLDVSKVFSAVSIAEDATSGLFDGQVVSANWSLDNEHILIEVSTKNAREWAILNVKNVQNSVNITREFNADFSMIKIFDNSASNLLAIKDGNLHRIDLANKQISAVLVSNVYDFDFYDQEIVFSSKYDDASIELVSAHLDSEDESPVENVYYVGLKKINDANYLTVTTTAQPAHPVVGRFYDQDFVAVLCGDKISIYEKPDFKLVLDNQLDFAPTSIKIGHVGDFITMSEGGRIVTLDMEDMSTTAWSTETDKYGWLDGNMIYAVKDGSLTVYDYDGLNARTLSSNVSSKFPAVITENKWLYYISDEQLVRETIAK